MKIKKTLYYIVLCISFGMIYYCIELAFDGKSHWTMYCLGMICGIGIDLINEHKLTWDMPLWKQVLYGEGIVLPLEFITGIILHKVINIQPPVWDYSDLWGNILGQFSPLFALIFIPVILFGIFYADFYRWLIMKEEKPRYKLF